VVQHFNDVITNGLECVSLFVLQRCLPGSAVTPQIHQQQVEVLSEFTQLLEPDVAASACTMHKSDPIGLGVNDMGVEMKHQDGKIPIMLCLHPPKTTFVGKSLDIKG
jgi:hypothetical protein